jgi:hypothetical protein
MQRKYRLILSLSALLLMAASPGAHARGYASTGKCGIYPRLAITSPSGTCVGLIADDAHGLRFPRRVLELSRAVSGCWTWATGCPRWAS